MSRGLLKRSRSDCRDHRSPQLGRRDLLERIVRDYITEYQLDARREMKWFSSTRSLDRAVELATLSNLPSGKRHPHQRRIPVAVLEKVRDWLLATDLLKCRSFDELHATVQRAVGQVHGAGELLVYDVAHRIGAYLGLEPERVYLHAGTRAGASVLGLGRGRQYLKPEELPGPFGRLKPAEIEDCLCIYRDELSNVPPT